MRLVQHLALQLHRAGALVVFKGLDDGLRVGDLGFVRREAGVDGLNLIRVYRNLAGEAGAGRDGST